MKAEPVTELVGAVIRMTAGEARELYAELYRISSDRLMQSYRDLGYGQIASLMISLGQIGADS